MFKSCQYCGGVHPVGYVCPKKPVKRYDDTQINKFRWSNAWRKKREQIQHRDHYLCQCCFRLLDGTVRQYEYEDLSVHHVDSLQDDYGRRLDDYNLITLCRHHHEMADDGRLDKEQLFEIVKEQMKNYGNI